MNKAFKGGIVVMPYDEANKHRNNAGKMTDKWQFLLNCFGKKNCLGESGWNHTAQRIQETNQRHSWNLVGLEHYKTNPHLKRDTSLSIFEHIQEVFEKSKTTLTSVTPIKFLSSPQIQSKPMIEEYRKFSSMEVESLLVLAFFCTFPYRNSDGEMPSINFNNLYTEMNWGGKRPQAAKAKMDCIWQYFASCAYENKNKTQGREIEFKRRSMKDFPEWEVLQSPLSAVSFSNCPMEDQDGPVLEVDFANKVVGGGILGSGAVQEEIRMAIAPEMIVARLFTSPLEDNEVLFITGAKRFSRTSGYSNTLKFESHYEDMERMRKVVAMDATEYKDPRQQYNEKEIKREINKAFCAFFSRSRTKIATGHWGCGVYGGDRELKAILQLLAASEAERDIVYCMPGVEFERQFKKTLDILRAGKVSIGAVFKAINDYGAKGAKGSLFMWLQTKFKSNDSGHNPSWDRHKFEGNKKTEQEKKEERKQCSVDEKQNYCSNAPGKSSDANNLMDYSDTEQETTSSKTTNTESDCYNNPRKENNGD